MPLREPFVPMKLFKDGELSRRYHNTIYTDSKLQADGQPPAFLSALVPVYIMHSLSFGQVRSLLSTPVGTSLKVRITMLHSFQPDYRLI